MESIENILNLQGKILSEINRDKKSLDVQDYEFKIYSQWGEDGIIQFLISKLPIKKRVFVEFGVENYQEANTRFLLQNNNWTGLIIDKDQENINSIVNSGVYWRHSLTAVSKLITKDNINDIILRAGISGDVGILSIDVDGNDYWIFEAIECINPSIVIAEYNSLFGKNLKISVPYDKNFIRAEKHYSGLYYGASIAALTELANKKGYCLVGSNTAGCNLFFVKDKIVGDIKTFSPSETYEISKFRQSRDNKGNLSYLSHEDGLKLIGDMEVINLENSQRVKIKNLNV